MKRDGITPYGWMLASCGWFSAMGVLAHGLKESCDWQAVAFARSALATLFAFLLALAVGTPLVFLRPRVLWIRSLAGSSSMVGTFYALMHLPVSDVLTLTNTYPIWVAILSWPLAGERPTLSVWGAVGCAVAGVAITQNADFSQLDSAHFAALFAAFFTAIAMLGLNRLHGVASLAVVVHFSAVSTVVCAIAYFTFETPIGTGHQMESPVLLQMLAVGVTATVGQVFLTKAYRAGSATRVSVVGLSQVVMVMIYEAMVEGRHFEIRQIIGTVLVLGPTAYLMVRERRRASAPVVEPIQSG